MKRLVELSVMLLGLSACAPMVWDKRGATQQDYNKDSYECEKDARQSGCFGGGVVGSMNMKAFFKQCMVAHGWTLRQESTESSLVPANASEKSQSNQTTQIAQPRIAPPIVIAAGSLDSSTLDRYDPVVVIVSNAPGVSGQTNTIEGFITSSMLSYGWTLVERAKIQSIFEEQQFQLKNANETAQLVRVGKLAGAKAVVLGTISEWKQEKIKEQTLSSVSLGFKIIDVETGAILFNGQGYYAYPLRDPPQVIAQNLFANIIAQLSANVGLRGLLGAGWKLTDQDGHRTAVITKVMTGTPAEQAGLKAGDLLLSCNGKSVMNWKNQRHSLMECRTDPRHEMVFQIDMV